jgi:hypothetical protein
MTRLRAIWLAARKAGLSLLIDRESTWHRQ